MGLNLEALTPKSGRSRAPIFTEAEMKEIHAAYERGVSIRQIHEATGRAKTVNALGAIYRTWKQQHGITGERKKASKGEGAAAKPATKK